MKDLFTSWLRWFRHGVRILVAGFGAYLIVGVCASFPRMLGDIHHPVVGWALIILAPIVWLIGIASFGYLFTKLYSYTTWCTQAVADIKKNDWSIARWPNRTSNTELLSEQKAIRIEKNKRAILFDRLILMAAGIFFLGLGVYGVHEMRETYSKFSSAVVPVGWYAFAVVPPLTAFSAALTIPDRYYYSRIGLLQNTLLCICMLSGGTAPILYILYDYEHNIPQRSVHEFPNQNAQQDIAPNDR